MGKRKMPVRRDVSGRTNSRNSRLRRQKKNMLKKKLRVWLFKSAAILIILSGIIIWKHEKIANVVFGTVADIAESIPVIEERPELDVELLTPNPYSRPQIALEEVDGIVIHYTANPGTTAIQNRDYFESLMDIQTTKASSHFVIGLEGEIVQCIPTTEISYASNDRNYDTLSIECCHEDETGEFNDATYESLVELTAWLCGEFQVSVDNVIRHYDVTGKLCPKYYVEHEDAWEQFKEDVETRIWQYGNQVTVDNE